MSNNPANTHAAKIAAADVLKISVSASPSHALAAYVGKYEELLASHGRFVGFATDAENAVFNLQLAELNAAALLFGLNSRELFPPITDIASDRDSSFILFRSRLKNTMAFLRLNFFTRKKTPIPAYAHIPADSVVEQDATRWEHVPTQSKTSFDITRVIQSIIHPIVKILHVIKSITGKINLFRMIALLSVLFGITALGISTYFEYLALSQLLSDKAGMLERQVPIINKPISFPMVILLEGTKAIAIVAVLYFKSTGRIIANSLRAVIYTFRTLLIALSLFSSMAIVYYYTYNSGVDKEIRDANSIEYARFKSDSLNEAKGIEPEIQRYKNAMDYEFKNVVPGPKYDGYKAGKEKVEKELKAKIDLLRTGYKTRIVENEKAIKQHQTNPNPIVQALKDSFGVIGVQLSGQFIAVFLSFLTAALIELSIYVAFSFAGLEFFTKKAS